MQAERGAALYCAYTALPTPTVYRRAGEVGNAVPLPYYQTCPPWAGRGPKVRPSGAKTIPWDTPDIPDTEGGAWGRSSNFGGGAADISREPHMQGKRQAKIYASGNNAHIAHIL